MISLSSQDGACYAQDRSPESKTQISFTDIQLDIAKSQKERFLVRQGVIFKNIKFEYLKKESNGNLLLRFTMIHDTTPYYLAVTFSQDTADFVQQLNHHAKSSKDKQLHFNIFGTYAQSEQLNWGFSVNKSDLAALLTQSNRSSHISFTDQSWLRYGLPIAGVLLGVVWCIYNVLKFEKTIS